MHRPRHFLRGCEKNSHNESAESEKKYEKYQQYQTDKLNGRTLTPDGLRVVCAGLDNDPEKIGIQMLEMLTKFRSEGLYDVVVEDE